MICIPIAPESRTLGRADLLNASRQADIVELCLDRFVVKPDVAELIAGLDKPVLVSCRRKKDGGSFDGSEEDRLALLQEALTAGPAYIELELEVAARIPRSPKTKRVISVNRLFRALTDLDSLQQQAANVGADVVKYVWPGVLFDSLAPVLSAMATEPKLPIVGLPIGHGGRAFGVYARRLGAPWVYAALEQGMETHDGMPAIRELDDLYSIRQVDAETRLIGAAGFGSVRTRTVRAFNAAFAELEMNCRCIPLEVGPVESLRPLLQSLDITAVVVAPGMGDYMFPLVEHPEMAAGMGQHIDLLLHKRDGWHGYNVLWRSVLKTVERTLRRQDPDPRSLESTTNLILGSGRVARTLMFGLRQLKGTGIVSSPGGGDEGAFCPHCGEAQSSSNETIEIAKALNGTSVPFSDVISTRPDVIFIADPSLELGFKPNSLNPMFLQPPLVVVDATTMMEETDILVEARDRGCQVVRPGYVLGEHLSAQFKAVTGQDLPDAAFQYALDLSE